MDEVVMMPESALDPTQKKPAAPGSREGEKCRKSEVSYSRGSRKAHCGVCTHFHWSSIEESIHDGTCDVVEGMIDPARWCAKFSNGKEPEKK